MATQKGVVSVVRPKPTKVTIPKGTVTTQSRPSQTPSVPAFTPKIEAPAAVPTTKTTTTIAFKPDASWWTRQFAADPRWLQNAPALRASEEKTAADYGYRINRTSSGQPVFKSKATGAGGITQVVDASGNPVLDDKGAFQYQDAAGNKYDVGDLVMDIQRIERGKPGYLEGALGAAEAGSENKQYEIGNVAAQRGAGRSGMRAQASDAETRALQNAIAGLAGRAAGEFSGIADQYRNLYNSIFGDLVKQAAATPGTEVTTETPVATTPTPGPTTVGGMTVPQKPLPQPQTINIAGQSVTFPKGIDLAGVSVESIGRRIAGNVAEAGGVGKLKNGQMVGQFRAGGKGYRVMYRGGKFVIELAG